MKFVPSTWPILNNPYFKCSFCRTDGKHFHFPVKDDLCIISSQVFKRTVMLTLCLLRWIQSRIFQRRGPTLIYEASSQIVSPNTYRVLPGFQASKQNLHSSRNLLLPLSLWRNVKRKITSRPRDKASHSNVSCIGSLQEYCPPEWKNRALNRSHTGAEGLLGEGRVFHLLVASISSVGTGLEYSIHRKTFCQIRQIGWVSRQIPERLEMVSLPREALSEMI